jgi:DNA-binding transcriptional MerR regulator
VSEAPAEPGATTAGPPARSWRTRLADPDEALYTSAVTADLLGVDVQTLRRLETATGEASDRPSGNQRRYSRHDIERLARAVQLRAEGIPGRALGPIIELEQQVNRQPGARERERATPAN